MILNRYLRNASRSKTGNTNHFQLPQEKQGKMGYTWVLPHTKYILPGVHPPFFVNTDKASQTGKFSN